MYPNYGEVNIGELITVDIRHEVNETVDNIIFTAISNFLERDYQIKVSKQLLIRALKEYQEHHPEEFE